jgi:CHAD domain-containing protein
MHCRGKDGIVAEQLMTETGEAANLGVGDSVRAYCLYELDVAGRMLGRSGSELHAGIHEVRKAIRHVRAALRLGGKTLGTDVGTTLDELGKVGESLSEIRDANVVVETLETLAAKAADGGQHALLRRVCTAFVAQREAKLASLLADDPAMVRRRAQLRQLRDAVASLNWTDLSALRVQATLARTMRRARRLGKRANDSRDGALRHRWRRRLRRLRHQLRVAESELGWLLSTRASWSWPDPTAGDESVVLVEVRPKALRGITDRLGDEHDLRILKLALRDTRAVGAADLAAVRKIVRKAIAAALK